ncbi:reverse transcriptase domain-containing protein [Artemisia annua]|uniref:Reverse transcriptase domain-containing protein n=1 Tax=Artemisia annua TaxID=35608 RepID=A0A2U1MK22_ARTAN|nr:reverse transcriptase domain-containing protein [Artemisia annua]
MVKNHVTKAIKVYEYINECRRSWFTKIVRLANESLSEFKERWTDEASRISRVPEIMQISSFIDGCKCPELAKRFSEKIPKTVTEMMMRVDDFIRSEKAYRTAEIPRGEKLDAYRRDNPTYRQDQNSNRPPFRGDRRRVNHREDFRPRRNDYYAPYAPARNDNTNRANYRTDYPRNETNRRDTRPIDLNILTKAPKEILATEHQLRLPAPPPLRGKPARENLDKYCDYHGERGHLTNDCHNLKEQLKKAMETGKLDHLLKDVRQRDRAPPRGNNQTNHGRIINMVRYEGNERKRKVTEQDEKWMNAPISFPSILPGDASDEPLIIEAEIEGYTVRRVYVDQGASVEVMYEHCFLNLDPSIRARLAETNTPLVGFAGEAIRPLGKIELEVRFGSEGLYRRTTMKFAVVRSPSPYNVILGRSGIKELRAIPSTIHAMMKFPTPRGVATLVTRSIIIAECRILEEKFLLRKEMEAGISPAPAVVDNDERTEEVMVHPAHPDQPVTIGTNFSPEGRKQLINLLKNNKDVFAWEPSDMTGVPRWIAEHKLNVNVNDKPVAQKKRFFSEEKNQAINKDVEEWLKAGIVRPVRYPAWISNPVLVKKQDDSWRMCIDFKNLNSSCQKDYYPLPEIDWKIESVMGFKYKNSL